MRFAVLIPLLGAIFNLLLAVFVLTRGPKSTANRVYFLLGFNISIWNLGQFFLLTAQQPDSALFWVRFVWFGVVFIPLLLFHLSMLITGTQVGRFLPAAYGCVIVLSGTVWTDFFITGVRHTGTAGWYAHGGPGLFLSMVEFCLMFVAIYILVRKRRSLPPIHRSRLTPLILAQSMLAVLGTNDTLPILGWDHYPFTGIKVYPYGSIAAVFYGVIVAYSVLQYQLLDVQVGLSRFAAQAVRFGFLLITALGLLLVATLIFPKDFTLPALLSSLAVIVASTAIASLVFPRLFGGSGVEKWERRILGDHFEYQDRIRAFIKTISWHTDRNVLLNSLHEVFAGTFRFDRYWIVLRDDLQHAFVLARAHPEEPHVIVPELKSPSPVFSYFEWERPPYLTVGQGSLPSSARGLENKARLQLARFSAEFAFPLMHETELFGLVLVGRKPDDAPMTATDLHLLVELTQQLSLVLNQIRLKDEILRAQELELLGRMGRGMAHDLNNLITPIWTLLQLARGGMIEEALDDDLVEVAHRNIQQVRAYIRESLFFSENARPDLQLGRLDVVVRNTVETSRSNLRKPIDLIAELPGEVLIEMDEILVQRLLANLLGNAIDASPAHSEIRVCVERLAQTDDDRDWVRLSVIDQGEGIPKENLERVLTPYFTTKDRGDTTRGFGLGLSICRRVVALHDGKLSITSQVGQGTTVQVDLPCRQSRASSPDIVETA
jgi:signal transduction histidine kinase